MRPLLPPSKGQKGRDGEGEAGDHVVCHAYITNVTTLILSVVNGSCDITLSQHKKCQISYSSVISK
jgi:hypothetical protein